MLVGRRVGGWGRCGEVWWVVLLSSLKMGEALHS